VLFVFLVLCCVFRASDVTRNRNFTYIIVCRIRIRTRLSKQAKGKVTAQPEENCWVRAIIGIDASVRPPHTRVLTCTGIQFS
jgi:hypothetical protein